MLFHHFCCNTACTANTAINHRSALTIDPPSAHHQPVQLQPYLSTEGTITARQRTGSTPDQSSEHSKLWDRRFSPSSFPSPSRSGGQRESYEARDLAPNSCEAGKAGDEKPRVPHLDVLVHRRAGCQPLGLLSHGAAGPPAAEGSPPAGPGPGPAPPRRPGSQGRAAERAEPDGEPHAAAARPRGALPYGLQAWAEPAHFHSSSTSSSPFSSSSFRRLGLVVRRAANYSSHNA